MPNATNQLVFRRKEIAATSALVLAILLGAILPIQHRAHASAAPTPLDDHSVSALTSLDQAMEAVAARVTPSVVNIAVTSKGSPQQAASEDDQQGLPPGLEHSSAARAAEPATLATRSR